MLQNNIDTDIDTVPESYADFPSSRVCVVGGGRRGRRASGGLDIHSQVSWVSSYVGSSSFFLHFCLFVLFFVFYLDGFEDYWTVRISRVWVHLMITCD